MCRLAEAVTDLFRADRPHQTKSAQIPSIYGIGLKAQAISLWGSMLNSKKPINFFGTCFGARIALLEGNRVGPGVAVPKIEAAR
jgi:predicted hotdog family 3-hydroxylacyl-ACP dehydratase